MPAVGARGRGPAPAARRQGLQADRSGTGAVDKHGAHAPAQHVREARRGGSRSSRADRDSARLDLTPVAPPRAAERHAYGDLGPPRARFDAKPAVQQLGALAHARQPDVARLVRAERIHVAEALAVVDDSQDREGAVALECHLDLVRLTVLAGIRDRLLRDAEEVVGHMRLELDVCVNPDVAPVASLPDRDAALDGDLEAELLERVRPEV